MRDRGHLDTGAVKAGGCMAFALKNQNRAANAGTNSVQSEVSKQVQLQRASCSTVLFLSPMV